MPKTIRKLRIRASKRSTKRIPSEINFKAQIKAATSAEVAKGERLVLMANSGRPMRLEGFFDEVVIDLKGARFDKEKTPIIADHDVARRVGHTTEHIILQAGETGTIGGKKVKGPLIAASGVRSSNMAIAKGIVEDLNNGFPFQVSVGATIVKGFFVEAGDTAEVNGRTYKGPLIVASKTVIRELTVTVLGADSNTSTKIAASRKHHKEKIMGFRAYCRSQGINDPSKLSAKRLASLKAAWKSLSSEPKTRTVVKDKRVKASRKQEPIRKTVKASRTPDIDPVADTNRRSAQNLRRLSRINEIAASLPQDLVVVEKNGKKERKLKLADIQARAVKENWSADKFELFCRRAEYSNPQEGPGIHSKNSNLESQVLECAILKAAQTIPMSGKNDRTGKKFGIEEMFDEKVLNASDDRKYRSIGHSIDAILDAQIRAAGYTPTVREGSELMAQAHKAWSVIKASGMSNLNILEIFENVMNKASYAGFVQSEGVWNQLCGRRPLNDFKPHSLYRLDLTGAYKKVGQDGELKHVGMEDTKYTIQADTFGAMIAIDRKTQINDDMGLVVDKARTLGVLGAQRIEESVFVLLLSNPGSFFASGNGNLATGGGSALSLSSLETARLAFRNQVVNGKPVSVTPSLLLVGTQLETLANNIFTQDRLAATGDTDARVFTNNEFRGQYRPIVSPYLNNTAITDQDGNAISGQSGTQWYLFCPPGAAQGPALVIGFLNGRETPYFDEAESQFNVPGGLQFRSYMDWGVAMHVYQMAYKSAGA